jgi:membrane-associated phospholipid phosphatase
MPQSRWGLWISLTAFLVFAAGAWQVRTTDSPVWQFDKRCAVDMKENANEHPALLSVARGITHTGGVRAMVALAAVSGLVLWLRNQRKFAAMCVLAAALGGAVNYTAKAIIGRERPDAELRDKAVEETNKSYPSGHAMGSTIGYGSLGYVGVVLLRRRWARALLVVLLLALVLMIGFSRVYLRAHWCSDVIGGYAIGTCLLTGTIWLFHALVPPPAS